MMNKRILLAAIMAAAPLGANAGELGYTYVEAGYNQEHYDKLSGWSAEDFKPRGYYLRGSFELGETPLYLFGGYRRTEADLTIGAVTNGRDDRGHVDSRSNHFHAGLGYKHELTQRVNLLSEISLLKSDVSEHVSTNGGYSASASGTFNDARVAIGIDALITPRLEGWGMLHYTNGDLNNGDFAASLGLQLKINQMWGVTGQVDVADEHTVYGIGLRASF